MQIVVETGVGEDGREIFRRMRWDDRVIEVAETLDQWHGPDYRYVKFRDKDRNLYILRLDERQNIWELTLFQKAGAETRPAPTPDG